MICMYEINDGKLNISIPSHSIKSIAQELNRAGNVKIIVNDIEPMKEEAEKVRRGSHFTMYVCYT